MLERSRNTPPLPVLLAFALVGCAPAIAGNEGLDAVLWVRTSAEYRAVARQAYAAASRSLERGLRDSTWTAALEQEEGYSSFPPAVILDVDETVLDNSPYQARLIRANERFASESWGRWVDEARSMPVPGSLEFTRRADSLGVRVFYVTNRLHEREAATRKNLRLRGFPLDEGEDVVLTKGERPEWGSSKVARRKYVAHRYRVLLLVGDDLKDFVSGARSTRAERVALVERYRDRWGTRWIVLPNPMYGSWEGTLLDFEGGLEDTERLQRKGAALQP